MDFNRHLTELNSQVELSREHLNVSRACLNKSKMYDFYSEEKRKEYKSFYILHDESSKEHHNKAKQLQRTPIVVNVESIIEQLASEWKIPKDKIVIEYKTELDRKTTLADAEDTVKWFNKIKNKSDETFTIYFKFSSAKKSFKTIFNIPLNLKQNDGKRLGRHLQGKVNFIELERFYGLVFDRSEIQIKIDDASKLLMIKQLGELVRYNGGSFCYEPVDDESRIFLLANERLLKKQKFEESLEEK